MFTFTKLLLTSHLYCIREEHPSLIPGRLQHEAEIITNRKPHLQEMQGLLNCISWLVNHLLLAFSSFHLLVLGVEDDTLPPSHFKNLLNVCVTDLSQKYEY